MSAIAEAKEKKPLPGLMHDLGLRDHAKKSARCPFHDDKHNSFSIYKNERGWHWKCHTGCGTGDEIDFLQRLENLSQKDAIQRYCELAGVNGSKPQLAQAFRLTKAVMLRKGDDAKPKQTFDWQKCVDALEPGHLERLSEWRGFSGEFCSWLHINKLVGLYDGHVAFPVHNGSHIVAAHHCSHGTKDWLQLPKGHDASPLIFGQVAQGGTVHGFEGTWDALAFMDISGERSGVICTRGAGNAKFAIEAASKASVLYLWTQNDAAGEKWEKDICANTKATVKRVKIPAPHKDLNDSTRAGATVNELLGAITTAETLREAERPLIEFRSPLQLKNFTPPPGLVLVGDFRIVKGNMFVEGGAPGVGKSRAADALAVAGATGSDWFGLRVHRRFRTMIVQTENGEFRVAREFAKLDCEALEDYVRVCPPPPFGLCFQREDFRAQLAAAIREFQPDVIIFDPWNAAARDERAREYLETFDALRSVLPLGDEAPALGIEVVHDADNNVFFFHDVPIRPDGNLPKNCFVIELT